MKDKIVIRVFMQKMRQWRDIEVPLDITAYDLYCGLNKAYQLGLSEDMDESCLRCENPIRLLRGNASLRDYGLYHGSNIII